MFGFAKELDNNTPGGEDVSCTTPSLSALGRKGRKERKKRGSSSFRTLESVPKGQFQAILSGDFWAKTWLLEQTLSLTSAQILAAADQEAGLLVGMTGTTNFPDSHAGGGHGQYT